MRSVLLSIFLCACGTDVYDAGPYTDTTTPPGSGSGGDLPCDVQSVLSDHCTSCHGNPPSNAPMSLVSYGDLLQPSSTGGTMAQRALARMTDASMPMPPAPAARVPAAQIAIFQAWLDAGMPPGTCAPVTDPLNAAPTCTSNRYWTYGNSESPLMHPGVACIACHATSFEAPHFTAAGTVYPTGHEPNDCNGTNSVTVVLTDAHGAVYNLSPNAAGNFSTNAALAFPIQAKVVTASSERAMAMPLMSGDCNSCHTPSGASQAPGRIVVPI